MVKRLENIIEALGRHKDTESIKVLEELGTNCPIDEVRELASKALIGKNVPEALEIVITRKGKGINELITLINPINCRSNDVIMKNKGFLLKNP